MIKFDDDDIRVGYIKQVLKSFNLPKFKIYTKEQAEYAEQTGLEKDVIISIHSGEHIRHCHYIKDNRIQEYVYRVTDEKTGAYSLQWEDVSNFSEYFAGQAIRNYTKTLVIKNNIYDRYTHEYLGDYLRFIRDYYNINLMPLYNCFSHQLCSNLAIEQNATTTSPAFTFDTNNSKYKIYMVPVKLFKKYTIAIECDAKIEMCCGVYGKYQDTREKFSPLYAATYQSFSGTAFNRPIVYSKLQDIQDLTSYTSTTELAQNEKDLKLFLKIPYGNYSSITILEGDYTGYNDKLFLPYVSTTSTNAGTFSYISKTITNHSVVNFNTSDTDSTGKVGYETFKPITELQLLRLNTGVSYPFADRLMEYLTGNVISPLDDIEDNIKRFQVTYSAVRDAERAKPLKSGQELLNKTYTYIPGAWSPRLWAAAYEYMSKQSKLQTFDLAHDRLGYIDKDIEQFYKDSTGQYTLKSINIYDNLYNNEDK